MARHAPISMAGRNVLQKEDIRQQRSIAANSRMDDRHILFAKSGIIIPIKMWAPHSILGSVQTFDTLCKLCSDPGRKQMCSTLVYTNVERRGGIMRRQSTIRASGLTTSG